ncbi:MAG: cache domain-containing protein [Desulfobacterales bacterium]
MMQITCDECEKIYRIDESRMRSDRARLKCRACDNIIVVTRPVQEQETQPSNDAALQSPPASESLPQPAVIPGPAPGNGNGNGNRVAAAPSTAAEQPPAAEADDADLAPGLARQKIRFGLFPKIVAVMLIISLLPFIIFWTITYKEAIDRTRAETEQFFTLTANALGTQVDSWIDNNALVLKSAVDLPAIKSMDRQSQEQVLREIQKNYPYMYLVFTVGLDGRNVARSDDVPLKDYSDRQYYKDIIQGQQLSWQTLIGKTSKKPALILAVPIKSDDQLVGVLAAAMTVDDLSQYIANWKRGDTGFAFLVDEKGKVVAHQVQAYVEEQKSLNDHPLIAAFRNNKWTSLSARFTNEAGVPSYGHVKEIARGWAIALQQENAEVFDSLKRVQRLAIILLAVTIVLVAFIAWISARAIVTPIMKLTEVAERMSLGDLNMQINIPSKDEIGLLAQAIKRMQTSLRLAMERLRRKR